jgi:hypothetical protein
MFDRRLRNAWRRGFGICRCPLALRSTASRPPASRRGTRYLAEVGPESLADIVVDNTDLDRPRLRAGSRRTL